MAGEMWHLWPCCDRVGADITVLREREVDYDSDVPRKITEVLVRKVPDNQQVSTDPSLPLTPVLPRRALWWHALPWPGILGMDVQFIIWSPGSVTTLDPTFSGKR